jgi:Zn-dependent protease with chaperone function
MFNLFLRSSFIMILLFGLLFGVGMGIIAALEVPPGIGLTLSLAFAIFIVSLQFLIGPFMIQWIYRINWVDISEFSPGIQAFIEDVCATHRMRVPRLGIIEDGNPNAFTFGHTPHNARLVLTRGLLNILDENEVKAVIGHEMGHVKHWDFVVMTIAAVVPLMLYIIFRFMLTAGARARKEAASAAYVIAIISFIVYIISQYIVLLLSRVREYYADQFSAEVTGAPETLSSSLVKIAYGLARGDAQLAEIQAKDGKARSKTNPRMEAVRAFGIFDPRSARALAAASSGSGGFSTENMAAAMKWDLWNPWAFFYELSSTHPLPAKRIRALEKQALKMGQQPTYSFLSERKPESYWDEFLVDLFISKLTWILGIAAIVFGLMLARQPQVVYPDQAMIFYPLSLWLLGYGFAYLLRFFFQYRKGFKPSNVASLVGEVKVSGIRPVPAVLQGRIIGRGIPGLFWSEDLVIQDTTGFMLLDYRQPFQIFNLWFGLFRAQGMVGKAVRLTGWYRRSPMPFMEMWKLEELEEGTWEVVKTRKAWTAGFKRTWGIILLLLGAIMLMWVFGSHGAPLGHVRF